MLETLLGDDVDDSGKYLAEVIYGANDGIVTTFAVVASVAGAAFVTFLGYLVAGGTPLVPYALGLEPLFPLSIVFTGVAFFTVGASRSLVSARRWYVNGGEMFVVGMAAATVVFVVGTLLKGLA